MGAASTESKVKRAIALMVPGVILGIALAIAPAGAVNATGVGGPFGAWRTIAGGAVGGVLAGAVYRAFQPHMRALVPALVVGNSAACLYCIVVVAAAFLGLPTSLFLWAQFLGFSLVVGTLVGGLTYGIILEKDPPAYEGVSWQGALITMLVASVERMTPKWLDRTRRRHEAIRSQPFPEEWDGIVRRNVPYVSGLTPSEYSELQKQILVFVAEKNVEGCGGLRVTDEIRLTVAAQACLLTLGRQGDYYPHLRSVLVYPSTMMPVRPSWHRGEDAQPILGESWHRGVVVLAWDSTLEAARNPRDGHNVVFHEFAHQLDQEDGAADGVPLLPAVTSYRTWASVISREHKRLTQLMRNGRSVVLDPYGAQDPAELFAVATEAFFERGPELRESWPELYAELKSYYAQDPASRILSDIGHSEDPRTHDGPGRSGRRHHL